MTLYTGAYFAGAVIIAVTASAASLVLAAPIARTWTGDADTLLPHLRTIMRAGLVDHRTGRRGRRTDRR